MAQRRLLLFLSWRDQDCPLVSVATFTWCPTVPLKELDLVEVNTHTEKTNSKVIVL